MKNFNKLISTIQQVHGQLQASATSAVNQALTIRNWIIGYYIVEFEQNGEDRAVYGDKLIEKLAVKLKHIKGIDRRSLFKFRQFYIYYPHIESAIRGSLSPELEMEIKVGTLSTLLSDYQIVGTLSPLFENNLVVPPQKLISKLSYSHLELLLNIDNQLKRTFYELECIKGTWGVRELKRQINSLYFERSGLSANPEKLSALIKQKTLPQTPTDIIKNIYSFEFLDLNIKPIVEESDLETALLDHLQEFILEKDNALVKYATAGMDENLFVQQYLIQLPSINQLKTYIENELRKADK